MTLKILGGKFGGRLLKTVKTDKTRPTTSLMRKAVFDILQPVIQDAVFLDLFAGSGAVGIEALSRGAKEAVFIDSERQAVRCIHENLELLKVAHCGKVIQADAINALEKLKKVRQAFDIIYVDPPYHRRQLYLELIHWLDREEVLKKGGILFMETKFPSPLEGIVLTALRPLQPRRYGDSLLCEYRK